MQREKAAPRNGHSLSSVISCAEELQDHQLVGFVIVSAVESPNQNSLETLPVACKKGDSYVLVVQHKQRVVHLRSDRGYNRLIIMRTRQALLCAARLSITQDNRCASNDSLQASQGFQDAIVGQARAVGCLRETQQNKGIVAPTSTGPPGE